MRTLSVLAVALALTALPAAAQPVTVDKVEPPNWWVGMEWNEVQLMLYGENLNGITAQFDESAAEVEAVHTVPNASYAFVDVHVPDDASPGAHTLTVKKGSETVSLDYSLRERAPRTGRYQGFGPEDVVYLITPDRFANGDTTNDRVDGIMDDYDPSKAGARHGGDLQGIINHLDYLKALGVTSLWINPILENNGVNSYHGYKTTDFYRVDPRFGTNDDYRRLVEKAHEHGLKVIFDHINNHIGIRHPWVDNLPRSSWLNGSVSDHCENDHYKMAVTDSYAAPPSEDQLRDCWFVDKMPDLNQKDPYLATYRIQNTLWWIETTGLDGIREDTYPYSNQAYLARWEKAIFEEYPDFNIVGEVAVDEPAYLAMFQDESRLERSFETHLPTVMDFALTTALRDYLRGEGKLKGVYEVVAQDFLYTEPQNLLTFFDNHDMPRGTYVADGATRRVKQALTILLTTRGIPQLLYGTEIDMRGGESHVELRADFPGGFPNDSRSAFTESGRTAEENEMFAFVQKLLDVRAAHPALTQGRLEHYPPYWQNDVYKYVRQHESETILVLVNGHDERRTVDLSDMSHLIGADARFTDLMTGANVTLTGEREVTVEALGERILERTSTGP